ncbi:hypothetical protein LCGC14_1383680 [marine sediment metagenome]|uniref:Uncharacterized protein n=1 Tax=marine sediment metagenome TaxID=412755 RepID=A0A0F9KMS7_9ZZZZ
MEMTQYYKDKLAEGQQYENFVMSRWPDVYPNRKLTIRESKYAQLKGETEEGIEIKYDGRMEETGRVYIEMQEKTHIDNEKYVESGIYRNDNSKLFLIGNMTQWFLFSKEKLVWLDRLDPPFLYRPKPTGTSIGFCIPVENAKHLCLDHKEFFFS